MFAENARSTSSSSAAVVAEQVDPADPRPHLPALDGVRGMAVLLVVALHAMLIVPRAGGIDHVGWQALRGGWIGVDLFFVLSGFLITGILFDAKPAGRVTGAGGFFLNFFARRILRIAPLYYGFLAFYFYVLPRLPLPDADAYRVGPEVRPMLWLYLYNFWGAIHGGMHANLGVLWSLCVEEHFYLIWPFVVWFLGRRQLMWMCATLGVLSLACRAAVIVWYPNEHAAYLMTPCRFDGLAAGAFVALALRDKNDWRRLMYWAPRVGLATGAFLLGMVMGQRHLRDDVDFRGQNLPGVDSSVLLCIGLGVISLLFASLVAMTVNTAADAKHPLQRIFRNPLLRSLGMYSYAIYVFHPLIISLSKRGLTSVGVEYPKSSVGALVTRLVAIPVFLAMAYAVAFVSYHLYEKHFLALKRFFPPSRKPVPTPAEQVETTVTTTPLRRPQFERPGAAASVASNSTESDPHPGYRLREAMRGSLP